MEEIRDIAILLTPAGCVPVVTIATQYFKSLLPDWLPIRLFVWLLCFALIIGATILTGATPVTLFVGAVNSVVAASACLGAYEVTYNRTGQG